MSRKSARKHGFCLLFQMGFSQPFEDSELVELYLSENPEIEELDWEFIRSEIKGVCQHKQEIDDAINQTATKWDLSRMPRVDVAIMRLALYEMWYVEDIADSVAINEAVELAKEFGGEDSPAFINGILGKLSKEGKG